jgi:GNAT superfamily N-acetyltransferase
MAGSMRDDVRLRAATPADTEAILDLVGLSLGKGKIPRRPEYWKWKHHENPFGSSPCLLAESAGVLVGLRVFMRWKWRAHGVEWPAVRAVDTATHPDWRGRGIFSRLTLALLEEMRAKEVAFVFNTPNSQSRPGYLKMGWTSLGGLSIWARPLRLGASPVAPSPNGSGGPGNGEAFPRVGTPIEQLLEHGELSAFLDALPSHADRFTTPRNLRYLRWRYAAVPGFHYRALWDIEGGEGAVVIIRTKGEGRWRELRLCELLVGGGPKSLRAGRRLLRSLGDADANFATAMARAGTPEQRVLLRSGFLPAPRMGPVMTVRPLNSSSNGIDPLRRAAWNLSTGDLELF